MRTRTRRNPRPRQHRLDDRGDTRRHALLDDQARFNTGEGIDRFGHLARCGSATLGLASARAPGVSGRAAGNKKERVPGGPLSKTDQIVIRSL